jgi:hypothetical protein
MAYRPEPVHYQDRARAPGRWAAGLALTVALALTFVAVSLFQLTGETAAKPALRDALNALVEGDGVVARNYEDLRARAEASKPGETLQLRDYPIAIDLSREEVLAASQDDITRTLLDRGVDRLYDDGTSALRDDESSGGAGRFTAAGTVGEFMGFLRSGVHVILAVLTLVLAGISVVLAIILAGFCRGFGRAVALGAAVLVASLPLFLGGIASYLYARSSVDADGEYLRQEFMQIAQDLAWLPVRNGLAFMLVGAAVMLVGAAWARFADARSV